MDDTPEYQLQSRVGHATLHISHQQDGEPGVPLQRLIRLHSQERASARSTRHPARAFRWRGVLVSMHFLDARNRRNGPQEQEATMKALWTRHSTPVCIPPAISEYAMHGVAIRKEAESDTTNGNTTGRTENSKARRNDAVHRERR